MKGKIVSVVVCLAFLATLVVPAVLPASAAVVKPPVYYVGDKWVYNVGYNSGGGVINTGLMTTVVTDTSNTTYYNVLASYNPGTVTPYCVRTHLTGLPLHVYTAETYVLKKTMAYQDQYAVIDAFQAPIGYIGDNATVAWSYGSAIKWPAVVGNTYSYTKHIYDDGPALLGNTSLVDYDNVPRIGVVLSTTDSVKVNAGKADEQTFDNCVHIAEYDPANPGAYTYEHWFNQDVGSDVKIVDRELYQGVETRELSSYTFVPQGSTPIIDSITPMQTGTMVGAGSGDKGATVTIRGVNFFNGAKPTVVKIKQGPKTIVGSNVIVSGHTNILCCFNLATAPTGLYDVQVTNPGGIKSPVLSGGFNVSEKPLVSTITPSSGQTNTSLNDVAITGDYFLYGIPGMLPGGTSFLRVKLTKTGKPDIYATDVTEAHVTSTGITCDFNLSGAATGTWNVVVVNADSGVGQKTNGFKVLP